jgi:hypothetical protein
MENKKTILHTGQRQQELINELLSLLLAIWKISAL